MTQHYADIVRLVDDKFEQYSKRVIELERTLIEVSEVLRRHGKRRTYMSPAEADALLAKIDKDATP